MAKHDRLTPDQVSQLVMKAGNRRNRAILAVMYQAGLRRGEIQLLSRNDYDPETKILQVSRLKRKRKHPVVLWKATAYLLEKYLRHRKDEEATLFRSRKSGPLTGQAVYYLYKKAADRIGLPENLKHPHCLRHSIASHLIRAGLDIITVQGLLGQTLCESTTYYTSDSVDPLMFNLKAVEKSWAVAEIKKKKTEKTKTPFRPFLS